SPMALVSPRLIAALPRFTASLLLLAVQSLAIVGAVAGAVAAAASLGGPFGVVATVPLMVAAAMLYFRLVGRLAWVIAERTEAPEDRETQHER
ncbi:MAG: hypothetical protein AAGJ46_21300, partial [Planctomycetota bacterium]